jgi:hypothetical protein
MSFKKLFTLAASALALSCAAGSTFAADQTYVVGAGGTYRPFEFETPKKELVGFDIDLIKAISQASNFKIQLVSTPWEGISPPSARVTATSSSPASPSPTSAPRWSTSRCRTSRPSKSSSPTPMPRSPRWPT